MHVQITDTEILNQTDHQDIFEQRFGTTHPTWQLSTDSDALELIDVDGKVATAVSLSSDDASRIRQLVHCPFGMRITLRLLGRDVNVRLLGGATDQQNRWKGSVSLAAPARERTAGVADEVVSELRTMVVVIDRDGLIHRFNRIAQEYTGFSEDEVIGRSASDLFMDQESATASHANIERFYTEGQTWAVERRVNTVMGPRLFFFRNRFVALGGARSTPCVICSGIEIADQ